MPVDDATTGRPRIRVVVSNVPAVLFGVIGPLIERQPELALVGNVQSGWELLLAVKDGVDVVVVGADRVQPPPGICSHLWAEFPYLKIVVLSFSGDAGMAYRRGTPGTPVAGVSSESLLAAIRDA